MLVIVARRWTFKTFWSVNIPKEPPRGKITYATSIYYTYTGPRHYL